ncbi:hypothetical protein WOLCODRAFT_135182 [Wolfiporia cocos MD-104 SS10]|uniref:GYF domain-containing protein n=1 Tax=Wolfiporia cocos (strain MD-104) TaxID=742152 RepID=A0A2H3JC57_WOLCO|nr:hypothetical protein WOLCODRAFT_135182 [Wolfiporia cocos MD-104 SS10]
MSLHPAGLSSDSLDDQLASASSPPPMAFDQWSGTHETMETDDERDIQEVVPHSDNLSVRADKVAAADKTLEIGTPSPATLSPNAQERASDADATSVHSMPAVQITEPSSPVPMSAQSVSNFSSAPSSTLSPPPPVPPVRRNRHRTNVDTRASNRLSGFFSSLIHRRDPGPSNAADNSSPSSPLANSSRGSSPVPSRASTPPPRLPPPNLQDLGLTLSSLTSQISSSHANGPPSSGAFLKPHYLLLCHAQGLDVLPLVAPPAPQPYALIRRVAFKSIVVMEHRGVLVAIAGRRNGVRVYALEDIKRAVEWRIEVEIRREQDRMRREEAKRGLPSAVSMGPHHGERESTEQVPLSPVNAPVKGKSARRSSISVVPSSPTVSSPRTPTARRPKTAEGSTQPPSFSVPSGPPPAYSSSATPPRGLENPIAASAVAQTRSRATSLSEVLAGTLSRRHTADFHVEGANAREDDAKADWASSDDEAINVVAAPSGSQALDERTSSVVSVPNAEPASEQNARIEMSRTQTSSSMHRRNRPANLDLSLTRANSRTTLSISPQNGVLPTMSTLNNTIGSEPDPDGDADEEDDGDADPPSPTTPTRERISLAEALMESRLPDIPPAGSRRSQEPILIGSPTSQDAAHASPRSSESGTTYTRRSTGDASTRRRRRWSVFDGIFSHSPTTSLSSIAPLPLHELREDGTIDRTSSSWTVVGEPQSHVRPESQSAPAPLDAPPSQTIRVAPSDSGATIRASTSTRPSTSSGPGEANNRLHRGRSSTLSANEPPPVPSLVTSRFLPRIITNAFQSRRSDDLPVTARGGEVDLRRSGTLPPPAQAPAPKLEYAKLPGTKGAVLIKSVETAKKSFLAILCGEAGEKVELFAGTYRTALQLSRTFILPDSPRSLELQLQGDDLVEVFLVFTQNVFGLEPATVRVREVRIGRAERRAARRRARESRPEQTGEGEAEATAATEEDTQVNVAVVAQTVPAANEGGSSAPSSAPGSLQQSAEASQSQVDCSISNSTDELLALAAAHNSPYTTFQQLTFAPNFPLASIADDYIIPPTYTSFLEYRSTHEPEVNGDPNADLSQVQFSPPGLPVPTPAPPSRWFYRDPKGVIHGPWKATLMQAWYRDGLLPPDLPVRREEDSEYILLRDLRLQCVDPTHPFRTAPPPPATQPLVSPDATKPLLSPISLLSQPRHFGPPALFYSSRGGHSTTIVDARGKSVLKGRFLWSADEPDDFSPSTVRLGDVKRLEAFDVDNRAVLVAMRQGGLEVVDFGDALLRPADHSRTVYPHFQPPFSSISRRGPWVWRIGTPLSSQPSYSSLSSANLALSSKSPANSSGYRKKAGTGPAKHARSDFTHAGDGDSDRLQEEVLFLGRKDDDVYLCERRVSSFRILRLSPSTSSS